MSLTIHCAVVTLLFLAGTNHNIQDALRATANAVPTLIEPYIPASVGRLPQIAPHQFTPPMAVIHNYDPKLPIEPSIVISPDVNLPQINLTVLGDPYGHNGPPSNGTGKGGGLGDGDGPGIGPGKGPGIGPGEGGDGVGGVRGLSGAVTAPVLIFKVEPEFSEEARRAKLQGVVVLYAEVGVDGRLRNIRVTRALGLGLEEKAIEAVKQWRFRPAYRNGKPIVEPAAIEVNFHLL
jgi:TonB family protein